MASVEWPRNGARRRLAPGARRLAPGARRQAPGAWRLAPGAWRLAAWQPGSLAPGNLDPKLKIYALDLSVGMALMEWPRNGARRLAPERSAR